MGLMCMVPRMHVFWRRAGRVHWRETSEQLDRRNIRDSEFGEVEVVKNSYSVSIDLQEWYSSFLLLDL